MATPAPHTVLPPPAETAVPAPFVRSAMGGFLVSGIALSFLGAILPAWGYHLQSDYLSIAHYFLALNAGLLISVPISKRLLASRTIRFALTLACILSAFSFSYLAMVGPPVARPWRLAGLVGTGVGAGLLNSALFHAISPMYRRDAAATVNLSGLMFGIGSLCTALLVAGTFTFYSTAAILVPFACLPAFLAYRFSRAELLTDASPGNVPFRQALYDLQSPAAVLFALLLFFQFGNEWSIAGWLPLYLVQRLGLSPANALLLLALYWLALLIGRILAQAALPYVSRTRLLFGSVVSAMLGCIILGFAGSVFGALVALLMVGGGFASIYPLVVEKIGHRFPYYQPGLFNGLFSVAVTGGLLAPALLGYVADWLGIRAIMGLPLAGSIAVFILLSVIWVEDRMLRLAASRYSGRPVA